MQHDTERLSATDEPRLKRAAQGIMAERALLAALALALLNGLIFLFLLPPWQHYDEPNHFEVAWLIAKRNHLPSTGEYSAALNVRVLRSMIAHGFYEGMGGQPGYPQPGEDIDMPGHSQIGDQPLYYLLASLPLDLVRRASIEHQLLAARLVSLGLYLLTVLAGWGMARELTRPGHPLTAALPISLALLPPFTDLMTAVNNDVAATAFFSLFLWGSIFVIKRGLSAGGLFWTLAAALLAYFSKSTAALAIPLLPLVWLLAALPRPWRKWVWGAAGLLSVAALLLFVRREDAAYFLRSSSQAEAGRVRSSSQAEAEPVRSSAQAEAESGSSASPAEAGRVRSPAAPLGEWVFLVDSDAPATPNFAPPFFQPLPEQVSRSLAGQVVTLGVWMWADAPVEVRTPTLGAGQSEFFHVVTLSQAPAFYSMQVPLAEDVTRVWVSLDPLGYQGAARGRIYYDGLVLVKGAHATGQPPESLAPDAGVGTWEGVEFSNALRNGSAESAGVRVDPRLDRLGAAFLPDQTRPSLILATLLDPSGTGWYTRISAARLLQTFWGVFAWGHVALPGWATAVFGWLSGLGLLGAAVGCLIRRRELEWSTLLILGLACALVWGMALLRGPIYLSRPNIFLPTARYAFPVVVPTLAALLAGWYSLARLALPRVEPFKLGRGFRAAVFALFFGLNLFSVIIIFRYYWG